MPPAPAWKAPPPIRSSNVYRTTTSDDEDVDELDPLHADEESLRHGNGTTKDALRWRARSAYARQKSTSRICLRSCLRLGRPFIVFLFALAVVVLLYRFRHMGIGLLGPEPPYGQSPPYYPTPRGGQVADWRRSYDMAAALVGEMTLVEKVNVTTGVGWMMGMCVGNTGPVPRLDFPSLCLQDGPLGLRFADNITAFPAGITVGATWDRELMYYRGRVLGMEAKMKGVNVLLGPSVGPLGRMPAAGRNWEGFGADPMLQGAAAAETIIGIQDEGVIATVKHYIGNEQEHFRQSYEWGTANALSVEIDDRTLHELYLWPFAESIRAGVGSVMCSYNMANNSYACQNSKLLNGILKHELMFQGFVQSDWLAQRSGVASALAGLDMSMPGDGHFWANGKPYWGSELTTAALNGSLPMERLNDMVLRIVATWYQLGQDDLHDWPILEGGPNFSSWTWKETGLLHPGSDDKSTGVVNHFVNAQGEGDHFHGHLALEVASEGIVVVKNEDEVLPLRRDGSRSSSTTPRAGTRFRVGIFGDDAAENPDGPNACKDRGCNVGTLTMGWGSGTVELPYLVSPLDAIKHAYSDSEIVDITESPSNELPSRVDTESQDLCIVFASADSGEGYLAAGGVYGDRNNLRLDKGGDVLIQEVAQTCGGGKAPTVVVIHSVGPVIVEDWIDLPGVKSVVFAGLPGQESGNAISYVLFGEVNPSGHLPYTIGRSEEDYGPGSEIMYDANGAIPQQNFSEGLYVDYRHFDKHEIEPRFEFGLGLSYTQFKLQNLRIEAKKGKALLPADPPALQKPPLVDNSIPEPATALFPKGFRKLKKYIYPYIDSVDRIKKGSYPYPDGYNLEHEAPPAGGAPGGNADLYEVVARARFDVSNLGEVDGKAVVQLYISYPEDYTDEATEERVDFPVKVLRAFDKVPLYAGKSKSISLQLTRKDLSYWCTWRQNWVMPTTGQFKVQVGFSSRDLPLEAYF